MTLESSIYYTHPSARSLSTGHAVVEGRPQLSPDMMESVAPLQKSSPDSGSTFLDRVSVKYF